MQALNARDVENEDLSDADSSESGDGGDWESDGIEDELHADTEDEGTHGDTKHVALGDTSTSQDSTRTEFLEQLFQLSILLGKQEFLHGDPGSTLLIYLSGIFGFSSDCQNFMLARQF